MAKKTRRYLKCDRGDYTSMTISDAYGLPEGLIDVSIRMHEGGHPGHKVSVIEEQEK
jgi:hypothetical protein